VQDPDADQRRVAHWGEPHHVMSRMFSFDYPKVALSETNAMQETLSPSHTLMEMTRRTRTLTDEPE
jgi:hypothetical protein